MLKPLASLRLTVVLLALTMVLVFAGTWAQIDHDVWTVQKRYFHTFFTWIHLQLFLPRETLPQGSFFKPIVEFLRPLRLPMPGGYALIGLLLANLLAAHSVRFKFTAKRFGIILLHAGLILLIVGEVVASLYQKEGVMVIEEGQTVSYTQDARRVELAVSDITPADHDDVTVIADSRLRQENTISYPTLPFEIRVDQFFENSAVVSESQAQRMGIEHRPLATAGRNAPFSVIPQPKVTGAGADASRVDAPSAYVTLTAGGQELGRFLVSLFLAHEEFEFDGRTWRLDLRRARTYKPYALRLLDFNFDRYTGTNTPRNFSSRVQLIDPTRNTSREVLIWMNHPLRYAGETFFQADWNKATERGTVLQVVRNPGWLLPYISCTMVGLGMLIHFGMHLIGFLSRALAPQPQPIVSTSKKTVRSPQQYELRPRGGVLVPMLVTLACLLIVLGAGRPPKFDSPFDLNAWSRVPILYEGRVMPLDSVARIALRVVSGKSTFKPDDGKRMPAIQWLADLMGKPNEAGAYKVLRIDHPDVKSLLGLDDKRKMFSMLEVVPKWKLIHEQAARADQVPRNRRDPYQRAILELHGHVMLIDQLAGLEQLHIAPPSQPDGKWRTFLESAAESHAGGDINPGALAFNRMLSAYAHDQPESFNAATGDYLSYISTSMPKLWRKTNFETMFNWLAPFYQCMMLYVLAFLLACAGWLIGPWRATLLRTAYWVLLLSFAIHTLGLVARIYIQGRPPVTNLYSSAIFIGWAAVGLCALIELIFRYGIATAAGAVIGFPTLIIAHYLSGSGDTMHQMQAVLDTNIWLATHVVVITLGYASTFLAGIVAIFYVLLGAFTYVLQRYAPLRSALGKIVYGIVCFAMLFSFVGTILGGIWADQSWGRFWGWDPKENGAALLVLWNAIILHARWGGLVRERGLMLLAIFGNAITSFSWFGTNMLGIGLHSYGFMDSAMFWLGAFIASQLLLIGLGLLPLNRWRSLPSHVDR